MSGLLIDGRWLPGEGGVLHSYNPASGALLWQGAAATEAQVQAALKAARAAWPAWQQLSPDERFVYLQNFNEQVRQQESWLAGLISAETGKPLWESRNELAAMLGKAEISWRAYQSRSGEWQQPMVQGVSHVRHRAHGVMAVFGPYNFPGHLPNGHIMPALLAGNTVVFKPSELTPATGEALALLWQQSGLPDGVVNLVQGGVSVGAALAASPELDGLLFTGSARTGRLLAQQSLAFPQRIVAMELGGNNPLIVQQVSDHKAVVHDILLSAFLTAGQRCTCARRLLLPVGDEGDALLQRLVQATQQLLIGAPEQRPEPFCGPLISNAAAAQMLQAQEQLLALGAKALLPLQPLTLGPAFLRPGILDVSAVSALPDEEYFGPLLQVQRYQSFAQALEWANQTRYGLAAGLFSDDPALYQQFRTQIRAGIVNWNRPLTGASSAAPFGGCGASGNYRPSALYAADYCAYPVASLELDHATLPAQLSPGLTL